jgi:hypothetical protein
MDIAAQDRAISTAHPNIAYPSGAGRGRRSEARFPDSRGPSASPDDGKEDPGLCGQDRARAGRGPEPGTAPPPPLTDAGTAFLQAVQARLEPFAGFAVEEIRSRRWASVTFQGARHELAFRLEGEGADEAAGRLLSGLDARHFALRGHLVADLSVVAQERRPGLARIRLEALTVEER